jgi:hypothetical protein
MWNDPSTSLRMSALIHPLAINSPLLLTHRIE